MSSAHSTSGPQIVNGIYEVASHHVGKTLVDNIRNSLLMGGNLRRADYYMSRSRILLQQHFANLPFDDQETIRDRFLSTTEVKERLESNKDSGLRKYLLARDYKRESKAMFKVIEIASQRAVDGNLMDQILEAVGGGAAPPPTGSTTVPGNPFTDSHAVSTLTSVNVHNLDSVEMETYRSQATGETAVFLELHGRDATTQEVVATIPHEVISGDGADSEAEAATVSSFDSTGGGIYGTDPEADDAAGR